ncbi:MAG TPA: SGNH/GDSL hydrolase family protein [Verrucomicrobiae bacterium]|jgi:lysophospholipase L1-like esterase|nr:SGNH/GDSL hydrolase family protein [Verrucomicrobiae bacterium]
MNAKLNLVKSIACAILLSSLLPAVAAPSPWLTTWACAPQLTEPKNLPPAPLANHTLRQFMRVSVGGKTLRVRLCNAFGTNAVVVKSAHLALAADGGAGAIDAATDKALTFGGASEVNLPAGADVWSDGMAFDLPPLAKVALSVFFGDVSSHTVTGHPGSRTTSYITEGNSLSAAALAGAARTAHWYIVTGIDVAPETPGAAIVTLGDSITDGRGSTTDGNDRWPDDLARRLATNAATREIAVVNVGIGGNGVFHGLGPSAEARFARDVLGQSGARWLIIFEGVNDIGGSKPAPAAELAGKLTAAYTHFAAQAHARGLRVYGATITPFGGSFYDSPAHETTRQTVNTWLRTNAVCDGVLDFDAALQSPTNATRLRPAFDSGDGLHPNPAGYQALANAIDLTWFAR